MGALRQIFNTAGTHTIAIDSGNIPNGLSEIHVEVDSTLGAIVLLLPEIAGIGTNTGAIEVSILDKGGVSATNSITITANESDEINNAATVVLETNGGCIQLQISDSTNWSASFDSSTNPTAGQPKFAYFYQTVADVDGTIAADNGKVLFETAHPANTSGFTTVAASGDITVGATGAGVYKVSTFVGGATANAFALFVDGVKLGGSVYGSGAVTQQNSGFSLVTLTVGDVVSLRTDNCAGAITLQLAGTTDTDQVVASILFEKLN